MATAHSVMVLHLMVVGAFVCNIGDCVMPPRPHSPRRSGDYRQQQQQQQQLVQNGIVRGLVDVTNDQNTDLPYGYLVASATTRRLIAEDGRMEELRIRAAATTPANSVRPTPRRPGLTVYAVRPPSDESSGERRAISKALLPRHQGQQAPTGHPPSRCCKVGRKWAKLMSDAAAEAAVCEPLMASRRRGWFELPMTTAATVSGRGATADQDQDVRKAANVGRQLRRCFNGGQSSRDEARMCCTAQEQQTSRRRLLRNRKQKAQSRR